MKVLRAFLWMAVVIVAGLASYTFINQQTESDETQQAVAPIGGPFNLVNHKGEAITRDDILGKNHAIFFGFTNCPDVCPTTLLEVASWLKDLGPDADKLDFYFFSVDPARDTPEVMNDYVTAFDPRITGVTGDEAEMNKTIKAYRAYAKKVQTGEQPDDYTMDHSASVMMFGESGNFRGTISFGENDEVALEKLRRLVKDS